MRSLRVKDFLGIRPRKASLSKHNVNQTTNYAFVLSPPNESLFAVFVSLLLEMHHDSKYIFCRHSWLVRLCGDALSDQVPIGRSIPKHQPSTAFHQIVLRVESPLRSS